MENILADMVLLDIPAKVVQQESTLCMDPLTVHSVQLEHITLVPHNLDAHSVYLGNTLLDWE